MKTKYISIMALSTVFFLAATSIFSEVRTHEDVDEEYWRGLTHDKKLAKRLMEGRQVRNEFFTIKNISFNRRPHPNGRGDYLSVTFDIFNKLNAPFEGYMFVVASSDKRYKKGPHYYVIIDNVSPNPTGSDYNIREGFFPIIAKDVANNEKNKEVLGALTKEELMANRANDPTKGIPFKVQQQMQIDIKHFMLYSREQKFFDHVTILIYGKNKERVIASKLIDDPKRQGKKIVTSVDENKKDANNQPEYLLEDHHPLLFSRRFLITPRHRPTPKIGRVK